MGTVKNWIGAGCLGLLACGGISERGADDRTAGSSSGGSAGRAARGGSANSGGGMPAVTGGSGVVPGGATMTPPQPPIDAATACFNDSDCPGNACGSEVCNWTKIAEVPIGMKAFSCNAAGTQPKSKDGWCTTDADCKCLRLGAKCIQPYCTFTRPSDAPGQ